MFGLGFFSYVGYRASPSTLLHIVVSYSYMSIMKKPRCKAADPSTCRFHGSQAVLVAVQRYEVANRVYLATLDKANQTDYDSLVEAYDSMFQASVDLLTTPGGFEAGLKARESATDPNEVIMWDRAFGAASFKAEFLESQETLATHAANRSPFAPRVDVPNVLVVPRGERVTVNRNGQRVWAVGGHGSYSFSWNMDNGRLLAHYYDEDEPVERVRILREGVSSEGEATLLSNNYIAQIYS